MDSLWRKWSRWNNNLWQTKVIELKDNKLRKFIIDPEKLGFKKVSLDKIKGKDAIYNANQILKLFKNKDENLYFKHILLNTAACLLYLKTKILRRYEIANKNIINGNALKLNQLDPH